MLASPPDERFDAAALDQVHSETDDLVTLPPLSMNSVEALDRAPDDRDASQHAEPSTGRPG